MLGLTVRYPPSFLPPHKLLRGDPLKRKLPARPWKLALIFCFPAHVSAYVARTLWQTSRPSLRDSQINKDHTQRFHESLSELKSLKLPTTGECIVKDFAQLPLNSVGNLSNAAAQPLSQSLQTKCTPLKSPLNLTVIQEGIENYGSKQHALQSQVKCTRSQTPFDSTVVQEDIENYGSKKYTLRSRARKLSTTKLPQRVTRSRAKQSVATGSAAASNNLPESEFTVLQDDFVEARNKKDGQPQQPQQGEPFAVSPKKCDAFAFHVTPSIPKQSPCLMTAVSHGTNIGHSVSPKKCDDFAIHVSPSIPKQSPCLTTAVSHGTDIGHSISRKRKISVCEVPGHGQHTCKKRISLSFNSPLYEAFVIDEIVVHSPPGGIMKQLSPHDPLRTNYLERLKTPIMDYVEQKKGSLEINGLVQKDLASGMTLEGPDEGLSQVHGEVARSSNLVEKSNSKVMECILSCAHDEKAAPPEPAEVNTNGLTPSCEQIEESIVATHQVEQCLEDQLKVLEYTSSFVSAHGEVAKSNNLVEKSNSKGMECILSCAHDEKAAPPEPAEVNTNGLTPSCEQIEESIVATHEVEQCLEDQLKVLEHTSSFVSEGEQIYGASCPVHSVAKLQAEGSISSSHNKEVSLVKPAAPCLYEHVGEKLVFCSKLEDTNHGVQPAGSSPARLRCEKSGTGSLFQSDSPQEALQAVSCQLAEESLASGLNEVYHSAEAFVLENLPMQPSSVIQSTSPVASLKGEEASDIKMVVLMPQLKETESCGLEVKRENPVSQFIESEFPWRPELCQKSPPKSDNSQMDCSESPRPCQSMDEGDANECKLQENESPKEWRVTPNGDDGFLKFTELLAQGTVNSSRRKRARSPAICTEESCKNSKRVKLSSTGQGEQFKEKQLLDALYSQSPTSGRNNSCMFGFPHFSPLRRFQDTFGLTCGDSASKSFDTGDIESLQRKIMGSRSLSKSYSKLPSLRKDYSDTPHVRLVRAGLVDRTSIKSSKQKSECPLITHLEEDGKENQSPETLNRGSNASILSDWQVPADRRKVLGCANHSLGRMESPHKRYNLAVGTGSFLSLVQQKQLPLPHPNGKREVRVKALEAAELARKQEMRQRKRRKLEGMGAKGIDSESATDKLQGITVKVKRVAELKIKMDQEKARKQEMEQRRKEEERKKKEAEFADKKRKREDADKRDREEKRKRVEEVQRLLKEQEERQRVDLNEKELKRKLLEERERERKAQEEEVKRHRRLEKEKEVERRRKQDEHFKAARLAEKQAERKRKEAMLLQAHGNEDDELLAQIPLGNKLSIVSTESFAVSTSKDWEAQAKSVFGTKSQTSGDNWGIGVQGVVTSAFCLNNSEKVSSFVENGPFLSTKQAINGLGLKCEPFKSSSYTTPSNMRADIQAPAQLIPPENEIQSYEISPYKSSSDDEDDDKPKKPVPLWARKENLLQQLLWQQHVNPDRIFSSAKTCSLAEIFGTTGSRRRKDFTKRSASGDWLDDNVTWKEELDYKNAMGYM
ncbi:hypothetical protein GOP47_0022823 [Adiantum capillus-veneris]|uniref:Inner centromere protein ARK-binding domain-containing protein n=1 Tax=Adiantum capillus-veneris TaxID=13818 RepID=A0A9D4U644_ADICA|nr:hypothetical protein GOP47_0022823 [Adiantum capillus-veneris]